MKKKQKKKKAKKEKRYTQTQTSAWQWIGQGRHTIWSGLKVHFYKHVWFCLGDFVLPVYPNRLMTHDENDDHDKNARWPHDPRLEQHTSAHNRGHEIVLASRISRLVVFVWLTHESRLAAKRESAGKCVSLGQCVAENGEIFARFLHTATNHWNWPLGCARSSWVHTNVSLKTSSSSSSASSFLAHSWTQLRREKQH